MKNFSWLYPTSWVGTLLLFPIGALGALGYAPFYLLPALSLSFCFLLWALDQIPVARQSTWVGWIWGLGYFTGGLYWISFSLGVDWDRFFWLLPFSLLGLPALLSLFVVVAVNATHHLTQPGVSRWLGFAACWSISEWLRGHLFTGFPWNLTAYSLGDFPPLMQVGAWMGSYGLGLFVVVIISFPYLLIALRKTTSKLILGTLMGGCIWGTYQAGLERLSTPVTYHDTVVLRLVQPNIPQKEKWSPEKRQAHIDRLVNLSLMPAHQPVTHLIWPEAAVPFLLEAGVGFSGIPPFTTPGGAFILGAPRKSSTTPHSERDQVWNSLWILDSQGKALSFYDKHHLVPFGEYLPFRGVLEGVFQAKNLQKITYGRVDFQEGRGPQSLYCPGAPTVSPLICYEAIFPGNVVASSNTDQRPGWLLNLTNDAWFGDSSGPYQHLDSCRFRALEEGLPLVRVANSGISAVVDPFGRCLQTMGLNQLGILDARLPNPLPPTFYGRYREGLFWLMVGLCGLAGLLVGRWAKHKRKGRFT